MLEGESALVNVPSTFLERLMAIDKNLNCRYNKFSDRFLITHNNKIIFTVEGRYPDQREIGIIAEADFRRKSLEKRLREDECRETEMTQKAAVDAKENIRDITKDNKIQLKRAYERLDGGKHNSAFRRTQAKPKGKVFK